MCAPFLHLQFPICNQEEERWGEGSNDEDGPKDKTLPEDPETCLQLNMVYQEVIQEKLTELSLLLAQNREQQVGHTPMARPPRTRALGHVSSLVPESPSPQAVTAVWLTEGLLVSPQEEVMWDLAGSKGPKVKDGKSLPPNLYIGHFMKPYFKDKVTGVVSQQEGAALWGGGCVPTVCGGCREFPWLFRTISSTILKFSSDPVVKVKAASLEWGKPTCAPQISPGDVS